MCGAPSSQHQLLGQRLNCSQGLKPWKKTGISISVMKCKRCGLIFSNPQPIPYDIQDHYGVPPDEYWKKEYFQISPAYYQSEILKSKELLSFEPGMKALDIGAGIGKGMIALKKAGFDTYGLEPSPSFREKALTEMKINSDRLALGQIENVNYPENYFDLIILGAVLEHLYDAGGSIVKVLKWLKPDGIIYIEVPSSRFLISRLLNAYNKLAGTTYVTNLSPMHEPYHLYEFGFESFRYHSRKNNYEIAHYKYYVCDAYPLPKFTHPFFKWIMKKNNTGMQLGVWLKKQ